MNRQDFQKTLSALWTRRSQVLVAAAAVMTVGCAATSHADAVYILTGTGDSAMVLDGSADTNGLSSKLVYPASSSTGYDVTLTAGQTAVIRRDGETKTIETRKETITQLLERAECLPGPMEMVAVDLSGDAVELTITSELTYYDRVTEAQSYETIRQETDDLPLGEERVVQKGVNGVRTSIYEVVWYDGELISRQFVEETDGTAVDEIIEVGTAVPEPEVEEEPEETAPAVTAAMPTNSAISNVKKNADGSGVLTLRSGETLAFSSVKTMNATAYTIGYDGVGDRTATGTSVRVGTVAVDPSVIPLGTRMYIVASDGSVVYGTAVAADTGVRGNHIDLYYDSYQQCIRFGRRTCSVYFLK